MAKIDDLNKEIKELREQLGLASKQPFLANQIKDARVELRGLKAEILDLESDTAGLSNQFKNIVSEFSSGKFFVNETKKAFRGLVSISEKLRDVQRTGNLLSKKELELIKLRKDQEQRRLEFILQYGNLSEADRKNAELGLQLITRENESLKSALAEVEGFQEKIANNFTNKIAGGLAQVIKGVPLLSGLSGPFEAAAAAADETVKFNAVNEQFAEREFEMAKKQRAEDLKALEDGKKLTKSVAERLGIADQFKFKKGEGDVGVKMSSFSGKDIDSVKKGIAPITKQLPKSLNVAKAAIGSLGSALTKALGPVALIIELVKGMIKADEQTVKLQKSMGLTAAESRKFAREMGTAARMSGDISITGSKLLETFHQINETLAVQMNFNKEVLVTSAKFMKHYGASAEEASNLAMAMEVSGESGKDLQISQANIVSALEKQYGQTVNLSKVTKETGNVTGQLRANLGGSVTEITKAAAEARLLGTSLDKIAAAGKNLLDFESAIRNEMEAEVLIGRDLDLSRAKEAALMGDQVTLMKELSAQAGSFEDFANMNVIAQEKFATALGMGTDELADQLFAIEAQGKTRKELVTLAGEERVKAMEAKTAQDKLNASMAQLQEVFVDLGRALTPILKLVGAIGSIVAAVVGFVHDLINGIGFLFGLAPDDYEFGDSQGLAALQGGFGNYLGEDAEDANLLNDAIITPDGRVHETNPRDHIIATQDPSGLVGGGNSALIKVQEKTNMLLEQLLNKQSDVYMDSNKVGTSLSLTTVVQ